MKSLIRIYCNTTSLKILLGMALIQPFFSCLQMIVPVPPPEDILSGTLIENRVIPANTTITLDGTVKVPNGITLSIEQGVTIKANNSDAILDVLYVLPGGTINAIGTASNPIVFTSGKITGTRAPRDWGGIQILGRANIPGDTATAEGTTDTYGGNDDNDSSGTLRYVRIEFAGYKFSDEVEFNGLGLFGVGNGTTIEYVQVHLGQDDGIEMFGGSVHLKWIVATGNGDDQIDCASGWRGHISNAISIAVGNSRAIEFDGDKGTEDLNSEVTVNNLFALCNAPGGGNSDATRFRQGGIYKVYNSYFALNNDGGNNQVIEVAGNGSTMLTHSNVKVQSSGDLANVFMIEAGTTYTGQNVTTNASLANNGFLFRMPTSVSDILPANTRSVFQSNTWAMDWTAFPAN